MVSFCLLVVAVNGDNRRYNYGGHTRGFLPKKKYLCESHVLLLASDKSEARAINYIVWAVLFCLFRVLKPDARTEYTAALLLSLAREVRLW
jgi:hypothetical protein